MTTAEENAPPEVSPEPESPPALDSAPFPYSVLFTFLFFGGANWFILHASGDALHEMLDLVRSEYALLPLFWGAREIMLHSAFQFGQILLLTGILVLHFLRPQKVKMLKAVRIAYFAAYAVTSLAVWTGLVLIIFHIQSS